MQGVSLFFGLDRLITQVNQPAGCREIPSSRRSVSGAGEKVRMRGSAGAD
jgi:hypothetical protein